MFADTTYANTIVGAIAPALSLLALAVAGVAAKRIEKHRVVTARKADEVKRETIAAVEQTKETIRGDLKNGLNDRLSALERGQVFLLAGQAEIKAKLEALEIDPPSHLG